MSASALAGSKTSEDVSQFRAFAWSPRAIKTTPLTLWAAGLRGCALTALGAATSFSRSSKIGFFVCF